MDKYFLIILPFMLGKSIFFPPTSFHIFPNCRDFLCGCYDICLTSVFTSISKRLPVFHVKHNHSKICLISFSLTKDMLFFPLSDIVVIQLLLFFIWLSYIRDYRAPRRSVPTFKVFFIFESSRFLFRVIFMGGTRGCLTQMPSKGGLSLPLSPPPPA